MLVQSGVIIGLQLIHLIGRIARFPRFGRLLACSLLGLSLGCFVTRFHEHVRIVPSVFGCVASELLLLEIVGMLTVLVMMATPSKAKLSDQLGISHEALHAFVLLGVTVFAGSCCGIDHARVIRVVTKLAHLLQLLCLGVQESLLVLEIQIVIRRFVSRGQVDSRHVHLCQFNQFSIIGDQRHPFWLLLGAIDARLLRV